MVSHDQFNLHLLDFEFDFRVVCLYAFGLLFSRALVSSSINWGTAGPVSGSPEHVPSPHCAAGAKAGGGFITAVGLGRKKAR